MTGVLFFVVLKEGCKFVVFPYINSCCFIALLRPTALMIKQNTPKVSHNVIKLSSNILPLRLWEIGKPFLKYINQNNMENYKQCRKHEVLSLTDLRTGEVADGRGRH